MAREKGVVMYIVPFTTIGVHSKALRVVQRLPSLTSPVWKIHVSEPSRNVRFTTKCFMSQSTRELARTGLPFPSSQ